MCKRYPVNHLLMILARDWRWCCYSKRKVTPFIGIIGHSVLNSSDLVFQSQWIVFPPIVDHNIFSCLTTLPFKMKPKKYSIILHCSSKFSDIWGVDTISLFKRLLIFFIDSKRTTNNLVFFLLTYCLSMERNSFWCFVVL